MAGKWFDNRCLSQIEELRRLPIHQRDQILGQFVGIGVLGAGGSGTVMATKAGATKVLYLGGILLITTVGFGVRLNNLPEANMNPTLYQKVDGAPEWVEKASMMKTVCVNLRTGEHYVVTEENKREMLAEGEWTTSLSAENITLLIKAIEAVQDLPQIFFRRVGIYAGQISTQKINEKSEQSHYFIKFLNIDSDNELIQELKKIMFSESLNTVGLRSISKQELIVKFNKIIEKRQK